MAAPNPLQALKVPGRLSVGATDLSTAYPHGGTALGLVQGAAWEHTEGRFEVVGEEFGIEVVDEVYLGEVHALAFSIRGWEDDVVTQTFPNVSSGSLSAVPLLKYPGSTVPIGTLGSTRAVKLVFTPDDQLNHPALYFPSAIPGPARTFTIPFNRTGEVLVACSFRAIRDGTGDGRVFQMGLLEDLTL